MEKNNLELVIKDSGLQQHDKIQMLLSQFGQDFQEAKEKANEAKNIVVTSIDQKQEMANAKKKRLELRDIRIRVEDTRKELKEDSLREGRAIDGVANLIKALIIPVEEHLEKQEKFAEVLEEKRLSDLVAERIEELSPFVPDVSVYNFRYMSDETYSALLENSKKAAEAEKIAAKKAEEDRIAKEKQEKEDQEKIRLENLKLKEEKEALEKKIKDENDAKEKAEAEAEAARKKKLAAPDKEKLIALAATIKSIELPELASDEGKATMEDIKGMQERFVIFITGRANKL